MPQPISRKRPVSEGDGRAARIERGGGERRLDMRHQISALVLAAARAPDRPASVSR